MIEPNSEIELSIANAKISARERQPIRHDVYLRHVAHYEDCIQTLKSIIRKMSSETELKINYHFSLTETRDKQ